MITLAMRLIALLLILLVAMSTPGAHAGDQPVLATDLLRLRTISAIDVADDGSCAVFVVDSMIVAPPMLPGSSAPPEPRWIGQSHLFYVDLFAANAAPVQLTFGDVRDSEPALSPDGRRVAFLRAPAGAAPFASIGTEGPKAQPHIMSLRGGEPRQVTTFAKGASSPRWSPDGSLLMLASSVPATELEGVPPWSAERPNRTWKDVADVKEPSPDGAREQVRAWLEKNASSSNPLVTTRLDFLDDHGWKASMEFRHLFVFETDAPAARPRRITSRFADHEDAVFHPDGARIAYVSKAPADQHPDRTLAKEIRSVALTGSDDRALVTIAGWKLSRPRFSRDGSTIAFLGQDMAEPAYRPTRLGLASADGTQPFWATEKLDLSIGSFEWLAGHSAMAFTAARRGGFPLMTLAPGMVEPADVVAERNGLPVGVGRFDAGGGAVVYVETSVARPSALMLRDNAGERLLYDPNPWIADKAISFPVETTISRPDGTKVQAWVMAPIRPDPARKHPLLLQIHGGPMAMWGPGEFSMWHELQMFTSAGYGVVYCNPRGSSGYGEAFQKGNHQNWGEGPAGDVLAAVDHAMNLDWVDRDRMVITGGSYGGFLTAWVIAHDNRFKAAVAQRGVYELGAFFGEGSAWQLAEWAMGGLAFDRRVRDVLDRNSPWGDVRRIQTPLLLIHGEKDQRVGTTQTQMLFRALKVLNKPVELAVYPGADHDLSRSGQPLQRLDRLLRMLEFFERYVGR